MGRRFAFCVNAQAGAELTGGRVDAARVHTLLCDEELGHCDARSPPPLLDCETRGRFQDTLLSLIDGWKRQDQLLLYFSGHGRLRNDKYTLVFGQEPRQSYLPFDAVTADLQAYGVDRAIIILDACQSGAALRWGAKSIAALERSHLPELPQGIAVLASCRETESSYELDDGSGSVFTYLLTKGIRSGLDGQPTDDGLIGPGDIIDYINEMLRSDEFASYPQSPVFGIYSADRRLWLAHNRSIPPSEDLPPTRTLDDLRLLYEMTEKSRWPCKGVTAEHLDADLVHAYAESFAAGSDGTEAGEPLARRLGLYSTIAESDLHQAAVLCFAAEPHRFIPQARAIFTVGAKTSQLFRREDVLGPLPRQVTELYERVQLEIAKGNGHTDYSEPQRLFLQVIREAISNAVTHRDYEDTQIVRISVNFPIVEIFSPGRFRHGKTFESLLRQEHVSAPKDAAIALYMTSLLAFEGIGRGFSIFEEYIRQTDQSHLQCASDEPASFIKLEAKFPDPDRAMDSTPSSLDGWASAIASQSSHDSPPRLPDQYQYVRRIAQGGLATIYEAQDTELGHAVAIKMLSVRYQPPEQQARLLREARLLNAVRHPGVVGVIGTGRSGDAVYIVMELLRGRDLHQFMLDSRPEHEPEGDINYFDIAQVIGDVAATLAYIHSKGVVHRDIKPSNIVIDDAGHARIIDFGLAKYVGDDDEVVVVDGSSSALELHDEEKMAYTTDSSSIIGTPAYMSPEQIVDSSGVDARSDIYSLGLILYELLVRGRPFGNLSIPQMLEAKAFGHLTNPRSRQRRVPRKLDYICMKALENFPEDRYQDAGDMAAALHAFAARGDLRSRFFAWLRRRDPKDEAP